MVGSQVLCKNKCSSQRAKHPGFGPSFSISCLHSRFVFLFATPCKQNCSSSTWRGATRQLDVRYVCAIPLGSGRQSPPENTLSRQSDTPAFQQRCWKQWSGVLSISIVELSVSEEERKHERGRKMGGSAAQRKGEPTESTGQEEMKSQSFSN